VSARQSDPVTGLYRTLLAFAAIGIVLLTAGLIEFAHFEPIANSGLHARIVGVYRYDTATGQTSGANTQTFARADDFAAVVDWSGLPDKITVQALWYDGFQNIVGSVGPGHPSELRDHTTIPADVPPDLKFHLPGEYIFAIERIVDGQPVEVLARRLVEVERS